VRAAHVYAFVEAPPRRGAGGFSGNQMATWTKEGCLPETSNNTMVPLMENEQFNLSLRRFLKEVGISSQQEIERIVRECDLAGKGKLKTKVVLTAEGTDLHHEVTGEIDLG
jgi:Family of unknown function (DUF6494)